MLIYCGDIQRQPSVYPVLGAEGHSQGRKQQWMRLWDGWLRVNDSLTPGCALCHFCLLPNRTLPTRLWQKILLCAAKRATRLVIGSIGQTHPRHTAAARQKQRCARSASHRIASHSASLAAETMLRRKRREQPVLGFAARGSRARRVSRLVLLSMGRTTWFSG